MFALLLAAVTATAEPATAPHGAVFRPSAVTASALVTVRILESATIDYRVGKPAGGVAKRATSLLIDGQQVAATLIEFP
jgi:hypothetical protein